MSATPGPWLRIDGPDYAEIHAAFRPSSQAVALVGKPEDADLIAAAPDLATALKGALGHIEHMADWITRQQAGYSFEALGEDMPSYRAALNSLGDR